MINIDDLIKQSLKSKDSTALKVYRNIKSDVLNFKTQKNAPEYNDSQEVKILIKYCKKLEDSILEFSKASREDLIQECREELEVLKKLLPEPVDESEIYFELTNLCRENGNFILDVNEKIIPQIPKRFMGVIINALINKFPTTDGSVISRIVKEHVV